MDRLVDVLRYSFQSLYCADCQLADEVIFINCASTISIFDDTIHRVDSSLNLQVVLDSTSFRSAVRFCTNCTLRVKPDFSHDLSQAV